MLLLCRGCEPIRSRRHKCVVVLSFLLLLSSWCNYVSYGGQIFITVLNLKKIPRIFCLFSQIYFSWTFVFLFVFVLLIMLFVFYLLNCSSKSGFFFFSIDEIFCLQFCTFSMVTIKAGMFRADSGGDVSSFFFFVTTLASSCDLLPRHLRRQLITIPPVLLLVVYLS